MTFSTNEMLFSGVTMTLVNKQCLCTFELLVSVAKFYAGSQLIFVLCKQFGLPLSCDHPWRQQVVCKQEDGSRFYFLSQKFDDDVNM